MTDDRIADLVARLEGAGPGDDARTVASDLLEVYLALAGWERRDPAEAEALRGRVRRKEIADLFGADDGPQGVFSAEVGEVDLWLTRGRTDGFRMTCEHRTALQLLLDDYSEWDVVAGFVLDDLEETDEEIRELDGDATPVHRGQIPSWAPRSYWWWWMPKPVDMWEYRARVFSGDLEEHQSNAPGSAEWLRCGDKECWCATAPA
ncbi:hypothetical protein [Spirillospora sp. CA-294931]|uniref:hypothetical protein n=1 Tax=Spirillospora sp. CA-294931 TaxID=3240042 RepID=UPI003D93E723